ncbi:MAG TPA: CoA ester lyase [Lichenihabitans sp.]|jgi:citrate lyase subunit beta/citryl-CoA lyase|nr:CoA ester lyase [Lichenihabitans sp.]
MRSLLFVPGDSARKLDKAWGAGADALILDLEDSVAPGAKSSARATVAGFLADARGRPSCPELFVRINALDTGLADLDLDAVMRGAPDGIMLPKAAGGADVSHLSVKLAVREAECDLPDGGTAILPIATETARSLFVLGSLAGSSGRLVGITWGAEDLSADLGAETNRDATGAYTDPYRLARGLTLFAAAAAGVDAVDTVFTDYRHLEGLEAECAAARRDGFSSKLAIHPDQVAIINAAFTPALDVIEEARAIVAAFAASPGAGVVGLGGRMVDRPHLRRAERVLARGG